MSVAAVALLAWAIGRPILRLKGHALAMATLGFGIIVSIVLATEDRLHRRARWNGGSARVFGLLKGENLGTGSSAPRSSARSGWR